MAADREENRLPLGIIGGLGPMATALFVEKIIRMTAAEEDQDHIGMIIYNCPYIPDRTRHILDASQPDPFPYMSEIAVRLERDGVKKIAIPCVTAQFYHDRLQQTVSVPVMDGVSETINYLGERRYGTVGILATDGTVQSNLFGERLRNSGMKAVYPEAEDQRRVMSAIYNGVKAGGKVAAEELNGVAERLTDKGAQLILLGCTELSVAADECELSFRYLDVLDVMSRNIVMEFAELRPQYGQLEEM